MFQAVRHWWGSGRGRVTARLLVFELLVVVIGVALYAALLLGGHQWLIGVSPMPELG